MDPLSGAPAISIVIPVFRDTQALAKLLSDISSWDRQPDEIVVVSADTDAATRELVTGQGHRLIEATANRGRQLDTGARAARGDVLWFLHADAGPIPKSLDAIRDSIAAGADSGCFRFEFRGHRNLGQRLLERAIALRIRAGGMVYGDQALFVTRHAYQSSGGFRPSPLFEEVRLVRGLRRNGNFAVLNLPVRVSTRRWERDGWIRRTLRNRWLALCFALGVPAERLARRYPAAPETNG